MRIEDLDGPRIKPGAARDALEILSWIGLDWDDEPITQSDDLTPYHQAMDRLSRAGLAYPCDLTRAQIDAAASAPHDADPDSPRESRFPPELRPVLTPRGFDQPDSSWRFVVNPSPATIEFSDEFAGPQRISPFESVGDFVVWTKRAQPAYQLAVVVDDIRHGITNVIRGDDLLDSAARQILLYHALGAERIPAWMHLPLVVGVDGRRLAKRHGDTRIAAYRDSGVRPERIIALMARWSGINPAPDVMSAREFVERFTPATMPHERIVFTPEDHAWLSR